MENEFAEVAAWKKDLQQYLKDKRSIKDRLYRNPDHLNPRRRNEAKSSESRFDPILNRYLDTAKDKAYGELSTVVKQGKRLFALEEEQRSAMRVFTMGNEPPRPYARPTERSLNIITHEGGDFDKQCKFFLGKKRLASNIPAPPYNILSNVPREGRCAGPEQQPQLPKPKQSSSVWAKKASIDPILMIYKDFAEETKARQIEIAKENLIRQRKRNIIASCQRPLKDWVACPPETSPSNALSDFGVWPARVKDAQRNISQRHTFESMVRQRAEEAAAKESALRLRKYQSPFNRRVKTEVSDLLRQDDESIGKVAFRPILGPLKKV